MTWAGRRRTLYLLVFFGIIVLITLGLTYVFFYTDRGTCFDGIESGSETGIDCGGECAKVCPLETGRLAVVWSRSFEVVLGFWNAAAYVDNPNPGVYVPSMRYVFRGFDADGILVSERYGSTYLLPGKNYIFETNLRSGERTITRTYFELLEEPNWQREQENQPVVSVQNRQLTEGSAPRLTAELVNKTADDVRDIEVMAILYDRDGNAHATSRTIIPLLEQDAVEPLTFTWPRAFSTTTTSIDIATRVKPR